MNSSSFPKREIKKVVIKGTRFLRKHSLLPKTPLKPRSTDEIIVAVDAMGGDHAPTEIVKGAVRAASEFGIAIQLIGISSTLSRELAKYDTKNLQIEVIHAPDIIGMEDKQPARAVAKKPNSSIVMAMRQVASGQASAVVSAGSTGAAAVSALFCLQCIPGIERPGIAAVVPTSKGLMILIDAGANVDSSPAQIGQHSLMGSLFAKGILQIDNPKVGLLNIGEEPGKGNQASKNTFQVLSEIKGINFIGNVEGRTLADGTCDVLVADGFVGNIFLKTLEGSIKMSFRILGNELTKSLEVKMGALMCKPAFQKVKHEHLNYAKYGGAVLLGVKGPVVIAHGISDSFAIMNAIDLAARTAKSKIVSNITESIKEESILEINQAVHNLN